MTYQLITEHNASAFTRSTQVLATFGVPRPAIPVSDVIHHWGDPSAGYSFMGVVNQFKNTPPGGSSSHYVLEAGLVAQLVNEADAAHTNSHAAANAMTVTWECNPRCSAADRETLAEALSDVWIGRGMKSPGIVEMHKMYHATLCPGRYEQYLPAIQARASALFLTKLNGPVVPTVQARPAVLKGVPAYVHKPGVKHYHVVSQGQTLSAIGKHFGATVTWLVQTNKLASADKITVGQRLRVR